MRHFHNEEGLVPLELDDDADDDNNNDDDADDDDADGDRQQRNSGRGLAGCVEYRQTWLLTVHSTASPCRLLSVHTKHVALRFFFSVRQSAKKERQEEHPVRVVRVEINTSKGNSSTSSVTGASSIRDKSKRIGT